MNNLQSTLLFPVRDANARKQLLIASLVTLAGMIVPLLPALIVMGYGAKIVRQVVDEGREPSMPDWQGSDWGELLKDGFRMWAVRMVFTLPILALMGCGLIFFLTSTGFFASASDNNPMGLFGGISLFMGFGIFMLLIILSLPIAIITYAAETHAITKQSFQAGFQFKEWWPIFMKNLGAFLLAYVIVIAMSAVLGIVIQIASFTIVLLCIVPFLMMGYATYTSLMMNALVAQAYEAGRAALKSE